MSVYVDQPIFPLRKMMMCHMWADTLPELHMMALRLGLRREWFQRPPKASWEHYDVCKSLRERAIGFGAIETDALGPAEFLARQRGDTVKLKRIAEARTQKASRQMVLL